MENIFTAMTALVSFLTGGRDEVGTVERRDRTPFGDDMASRIRAEQVTPEEVLRLIQAEISPFGDRRIPEDAGLTREELIELWIDRWVSLREGSDQTNEEGSEELSAQFKDILRESFSAVIADPSEGLEDLSRDADR